MTGQDLDRFWRHVIRGPEDGDCWIWVGAISDDGYGRFWVQRDGRQRALRPQRFAYEQLLGIPLQRHQLLMHTCDIPLCVHVDTAIDRTHLIIGNNRSNMLDRSQKGRARNHATVLGVPGFARHQRVARSRELRAVLLEYGWDPDRLTAARAGIDPDHPRLF